MFAHTAVIADQTARFASVLAGADPDSKVPTCPDWTVADLAWHLTEVHWFWAALLRSGALTDDDVEVVEQAKPARPDEVAATLALLAGQTDALIAELDARPDDQPAWSWFGSDQSVGFTRRMQVHEAVMHRVDAESAAGAPVTPIDPEVAEAGIVHAVDVMYAWWGTLPGFVFVPDDTVCALALTDTGRTVLLRPGRWRGVGESGTSYDEPGVLRVTDLPPDAAFTGTAEQVDRWLWGRGEEPRASGAETALGTVREMVGKGIQ